MENVLNRRMFQQPIYAQSGTYVPTIEQIMNFYGGGFTDEGMPKDIEAFQIALQNANKANTAGLFEDGKPVDNWGLSAGQDQKDFMKKHNIDLMYDAILGYYKTPGGLVKPGEKHEEFLKNYFATKASGAGSSPTDLIEKAKILGREQHAVEGVGSSPTDLIEKVKQEAREQEEEEYAQRQIDIGHQKELMETLQGTKVKNVAGEMEKEVSEDAQVEMIKRNILQGTNIVEPGTEEFRNLSAVNRMKVKDAITEKRKEELDLTDVSEKGMKNIIDAAGESVEVALDIWNDMKNKGGEIAEAANEMLEGWKDAISSGWSEKRKEELKEQIDFLKSKRSTMTTDPTTTSIFGVEMDDLEKGGEQLKSWYDDSIFPVAIEEGKNIVGDMFNMGNAELSEDQQLLQEELNKKAQLEASLPGVGGSPTDLIEQAKNQLAENQTAEAMQRVEGVGSSPTALIEEAKQDAASLDTSIFKEETDDQETSFFEKIIKDLNDQIDKLFSDRDNNIIDEDAFKEKLNIINDKKNELVKKFNETDVKKFIDKSFTELLGDKDYREEALAEGADENEDGRVSNLELFQYHLKKKAEEKKELKKVERVGSSPTDLIDQAQQDAQKKQAETIVEEAKDTEIIDNAPATIDITEQEIESSKEVADGDTAIDKADTATLTSDTVGLAATDGAVPAGTSAMAQLIAETAKETGYDLGAMDQTKDDLALKTIMYGLKLAMTPGKFHEAVLATGFDAVKNEINERYRTKASKQKFAGTLFNTMLAGKLDIEKERVKAKYKKPVPKKYDFGKNFQADVLLKIATGNPAKGLGFDLSGLGLDEEITEDNKGAKMFVQDIMNEMQMLANRAVTGGDEVNSDILFNQAIENLSPVYSVVTKDFNNVMSFLDKELLGDWFPGNWKPTRETTITRKRTDGKEELISKTTTKPDLKGTQVTEELVLKIMEVKNKTREEVIAELAKYGADVSGVK